MRLVCHIGTPKTASTLIQNSLHANPGWLAERGIAYGDVLSPDANHITLLYACANEVGDFARGYGLRSVEELATFRQKLSDRIARHKARLPGEIDTVVMSSENLTGNMGHPDEIARLKALLGHHFDDIRIVVYVRRQDDAILSMYGEHMRMGFSAARFPDFVDRCLGPRGPTHYLYYRGQLSKWIDAWGADNIVVRRFSPTDFVGGDILADFLGIVLDTREPALDGFRPSREDNRSLSAPMLEVLRRLHPRVPFSQDGEPNPRRALLAPRINQMPTRPRPVMAAAQARRIMRHFESANAWLKDTFAPGLEGPFFPERPDHPEHGNLDRYSEKEILDLTSELLSKSG